MSIIRLRAQQEPMRRRAQGIAVYRRDELRPRLEDSSLDWVRELTRMTASRQSCLLWFGFESERRRLIMRVSSWLLQPSSFPTHERKVNRKPRAEHDINNSGESDPPNRRKPRDGKRDNSSERIDRCGSDADLRVEYFERVQLQNLALPQGVTV